MPTQIRSQVVYEQSTVTTGDGVVSFNIRAAFTPVAGDLPDGVTGVFVKGIVLPSDPKADKFLRIATLADLGRVATSREIALDPSRFRPAGVEYITSGDTTSSMMYLSPTLTLAFDNLQVAIQAKAAMEQRIDALINDWRTFIAQYVSVTSAEFPLMDAALVAAAKLRYYTAITDYVTALNAKKTAIASLAAAQGAYALKSLELSRIESVKSLVCSSVGLFASYDSAYATYLSGSEGRAKLLAALLLGKAYSPADANDGTYELVRSLITSNLATDASTYGTFEYSHTNNYLVATASVVDACNLLDGQWQTASTEKASAAASVAKWSADETAATAAATSAQQAKTAAFGALMAVCPSYDPTKDDGLPPMGEWESVILG